MIPAASAKATDSAAKTRVLAVVRDQQPRPTELLDLLQAELAYSSVQRARSELLDAGELELSSDRHLRIAHPSP
jgi:hypothetical protein